MKESDIKAVASSLAHWDPIGEYSVKIAGLDGYKTEAIDIISALTISSTKLSTMKIIDNVLTEAFALPVDEISVKNAAKEIETILGISN